MCLHEMEIGRMIFEGFNEVEEDKELIDEADNNSEEDKVKEQDISPYFLRKANSTRWTKHVQPPTRTRSEKIS